MIRLKALAAEPHPEGNRIDLRWVHPDPAGFPVVRVVRREGTHPTAAGDGVVVSDPPAYVEFAGGEREYRLADAGLQGGRVYYYALFPYTGEVPPTGPPEPENRAAAYAVSPAGSADRMEALLPALYRRYDAAEAARNPAGLAPGDAGKGPLRRLLEVTGSQLDLLQGLARALLDAHDPDRVDGRLLPLLAGWIGWPTDHRLEVAAQRTDLRHAPFVYCAVGIVPAVGAAVRRVLGWEVRVKEFAHNVALTNRPERLTLWTRERAPGGAWTVPPGPLSLHAAYAGRPATATADDGTLWLFFHTLRRGRWAVWSKTRPPAGPWSESLPLSGGTLAARHPAAARVGSTLWAFWDVYDPASRNWSIDVRTRADDGTWTAGSPPWSDAATRRWPLAAADGTGGLWLFWMERVAGRWRLRYGRWADGAWASPGPRDFPGDAGADPRVEADPFVLCDPEAERLWVFWARRVEGPAVGQTRWEVAFRVKEGLNPAADDWGAVRTLPRPDPGADDREPAARVDANGGVELFWSSTRERGWSVWGATLDAAGDPGPAEAATGTLYSERAPLPVVREDGGTLLVHRSNRRVAYESAEYRGSLTVDDRYAGSTTVDTRHVGKTALRGSFDDFGTYTWDTGRGGRRDDGNWYAHDTVGVYLAPGRDDDDALGRGRRIISQVLREVLPMQVRAVLVLEPGPFQEQVYTYDFPRHDPQRRIGETAFDPLIPERYPATAGDGHLDRAPGWVRLRTWSPAVPGHRTVDFRAAPADTRYRTWHTAVTMGG